MSSQFAFDGDPITPFESVVSPITKAHRLSPASFAYPVDATVPTVTFP
jgi:hypothetical protein